MLRKIIDKKDELLFEANPGTSDYISSGYNPCSFDVEQFLRVLPKQDEASALEQEADQFHMKIKNNLDDSFNVVFEIEAIIDAKGLNLSALEQAVDYINEVILCKSSKLQENSHYPDTLKELNLLIKKIKASHITTVDGAKKFLRERHDKKNIKILQTAIEAKADHASLVEEKTNEFKVIAVKQSSKLFMKYRSYRLQDYGLSKSRWLPKDGIQALWKELSLHGALGVIGAFGKYCYGKPLQSSLLNATPLLSVDEKDHIDRAILGKMLTHSIIIVGMKIISKEENKAILYYIDPSDKFSKGKVKQYYAIAFSLFLNRCLTLQGLSKDDYSLFNQAGFNYFLYGQKYDFAVRHYSQALSYNPAHFKSIEKTASQCPKEDVRPNANRPSP